MEIIERKCNSQAHLANPLYATIRAPLLKGYYSVDSNTEIKWAEEFVLKQAKGNPELFDETYTLLCIYFTDFFKEITDEYYDELQKRRLVTV